LLFDIHRSKLLSTNKQLTRLLDRGMSRSFWNVFSLPNSIVVFLESKGWYRKWLPFYEPFNLLKDWCRRSESNRHGVEAPRDFESENRLFTNPLILKAVSLNRLKTQGIFFQSVPLYSSPFLPFQVGSITFLSHSLPYPLLQADTNRFLKRRHSHS
jgi:hypothetical protein